MRRHYWPSLLILRGKPKRQPFRIRLASANNRVRDKRLEDLERAYDRLMRERSELISGYLQAGVDKARVVGIEEQYRLITAQIELNRAEILGLKAREVPGWGAKEKSMAFDLTVKNSEEIHDLYQRINALAARAVGDADA